jgi:hypothetical protein
VVVAASADARVGGPPPAHPGATGWRDLRDLSWLSAERARAGLPARLGLSRRWSADCAAHDAYERDNNVLSHPEDMTAHGASTGGAWAGLHSVLAISGWTRRANPWENAPIHLMQLFSPSLSKVGIDDSDRHQCVTTWPGMKRRPTRRDTIFTYPARGADGVPRSENAEELPFVPGQFVGLPAGTTAGRELFVYLNRARRRGQASVKILSARLRHGRRSVTIRWVDHSTPTLGAYLTGGIIIPVRPMGAGTRYTVSVAVKDGRRRLRRTWSFTTAARRHR